MSTPKVDTDAILNASLAAAEIISGMGYTGTHGSIHLLKLNTQTNTITAILHNLIAWQISILDTRWQFHPKGGGTPVAQRNGNDVVQTPMHLAKKIVGHFDPSGSVLEPCCGEGNFLSVLPDADWCEISKGRDFLSVDSNRHWDWIITNPPYSKYRAFLKKSMEVADNVVFLQLINASFYRARLRDVFDAEFGIAEILLLDTPPEFPQFGFQVRVCPLQAWLYRRHQTE